MYSIMNNIKYKGYRARIEYSEPDEEFFGTITNLSQDEIHFGGKTVQELKKHLHKAVEGHRENCHELGIEPENPYAG